MTPLHIPINVVSWSVGSIALFTLGLKGLAAYRNSHNLLTRLFSWYGITVGLSLLSYYGPAWFTLNPHTLRYAIMTGYIFSDISLLIQGRVLWILALKNRVPYIAVAIPIVILTATSWFLNLGSLKVSMSGGLYNWSAGQLPTYIDGFLLASLVVPIGLYFMIQAFSPNTTNARIKSLAIAAGYILVGGSDALDDFFNSGADSVDSSRIDLVIFSLLLLAVVIPWKRPRKKTKETVTS